MSELQKRISVAIPLILLIAAAVTADFLVAQGLAFGGLIVIAIGFGLWEGVALGRRRGIPLALAPTLLGSLALIVSTAVVLGRIPGLPGQDWSGELRVALPLLVLSLATAWAMLEQMRRHGADGFAAAIGWHALLTLWLGGAGTITLLLTTMAGSGDYANRGLQLVCCLLLSVKLGDVAAFFGGRATGRHKMAPSISPGKSWEGFAWSFLGSIGGAYIGQAVFAGFSAQAPFALWWQPAIWGLVIGPMGVVGDLAESCLKRDSGVKDSSNILPGFGGILDILDAVLLAAPVAYVLAWVL